jgi:hypothetical protein
VTRRTVILFSLGLIAATAVILLWLGRVPICTCGYVKLWHGSVKSSENSQHITDWYSLSHIVHGIVFYAFAWLAFGKGRSRLGFCAALLIECGWEVLENTDFIINRYRAATIALDYFGDSVINSLSDILCMLLGYLIAARAPVAISIALVVALELIALIAIRDNLTLNVLMLLWPIDAIKTWQSGA